MPYPTSSFKPHPQTGGPAKYDTSFDSIRAACLNFQLHEERRSEKDTVKAIHVGKEHHVYVHAHKDVTCSLRLDFEADLPDATPIIRFDGVVDIPKGDSMINSRWMNFKQRIWTESQAEICIIPLGHCINFLRSPIKWIKANAIKSCLHQVKLGSTLLSDELIF